MTVPKPWKGKNNSAPTPSYPEDDKRKVKSKASMRL